MPETYTGTWYPNGDRGGWGCRHRQIGGQGLFNSTDWVITRKCSERTLIGPGRSFRQLPFRLVILGACFLAWKASRKLSLLCEAVNKTNWEDITREMQWPVVENTVENITKKYFWFTNRWVGTTQLHRPVLSSHDEFRHENVDTTHKYLQVHISPEKDIRFHYIGRIGLQRLDKQDFIFTSCTFKEIDRLQHMQTGSN